MCITNDCYVHRRELQARGMAVFALLLPTLARLLYILRIYGFSDLVFLLVIL